mgnify:CR=1 FL=1
MQLLAGAMSFANSYWSPDYKSGIDSLSLQSSRSLRQLHELRQLVYHFINYFHSNSQHLNKLAIDNYNLSSQFRPYVKSPSKSLSFSSSRQISQALVETLLEKDLSQEVTSSSAFQYYIQYMNQESNNLVKLSSQIDSEILLQITSFIKANEPQINAMNTLFADLLSDYDSSYEHLQKLIVDYNECFRLKEFAAKKPEVPIEKERQPVEPSPVTKPLVESEFNFPLIIGTVKIANIHELSDLISQLMRNTPTSKRKIPIPGYSNDIFVSSDLCRYLIKYRPYGINPSIVNLEKFGQTLVDLRLIIGTGFWSKKFKSEDMWFHWSDLAVYVSEYSEDSEQVDNDELNTSDIDETSKLVNEMAISTSKRINTMFQNVRSSLKKYSPEMLPEIEEQYNEEYLHLQETKHQLDMEILNKSQYLEKFETIKIEIIYQSLTKLLQILYQSSLNSTNSLHVLASEFIEKINKPENYKRDFDRLLQNFSTGIYFPTNIIPKNVTKKNPNSAQTSNVFQNIKSQFDLFKDIPLQLMMCHAGECLLSISSLPFFLHELFSLINEKQSTETKDYWSSPINFQSYWEVKEMVIKAISSFELLDHIEISQEITIHKQIMEKVLTVINDVSEEKLINFLKNWLLQTTDSLIPCMVYDPILKIYLKYLEKDNSSLDEVLRQNELLKQLNTISRSNLSSLVYVLENLANVFELTPIEGYQTTDDIPELESSTDPEKLSSSVASLNSMECIGSVPFLHLILRPVPAKSSSGFKPPIEEYKLIVSDLLTIETRHKLLTSLLTHENLYRAKKEKEMAGIKIKKNSTPPIGKPLNKVESNENDNLTTNNEPNQEEILKSPRPVSGGNFTLRPFRTKVSPAPSPVASPNNTPHHTPSNSLDMFGGDIPSRKSSTPTKRRSNSNSLTPAIEVEFEK